MLGDFRSTNSTQIGPAVPHPRYGDCLLIVKFTRSRPLAPRNRPPRSCRWQDQSSRLFLTVCSIWDRWRIPISRNVRSSYCAKAATAFLTSRSRRHFAHPLAMARHIMANQPGWIGIGRPRAPRRPSWMESPIQKLFDRRRLHSPVPPSQHALRTKRAKWISVVRARRVLAAAEHQPRW